MSFLSGFHQIRPPYELKQEEIIKWLVAAHAYAGNSSLEEKLLKLGLGPDKIQNRGAVLSDFSHTDWEKMHIFALHQKPEGLGLEKRMAIYEEVVDRIFEQFYPEGSPLPSHLIHVSCTGYVSPSGAQKIVARRNAGEQTTVTHAYHMGCYASLPALRMARGVGSSSDIVHTELCSLHLNPSLHETEQLVVQTLFGDGFIKYSLTPQKRDPCFEILTLREEIIPDSFEQMFWRTENWGFRMGLAKEIPVSIARALPSFLTRLGKQVGLSLSELLSQAFFAIHPGGSKMIEQIASRLELQLNQYAHSQRILRNYGNMSSATLPHIWRALLEDQAVPKESLVVSLAFGPGLTLSGGILQKCNM